MNRRKSEILLKLVESVNNEGNIVKLAEAYNVTEKTIRNDIKDINRFLNDHDLDEIKLLGNGNISLSGGQQEITSLLKKNTFYTYKLGKTERKLFISLLLIQSKGYVTISSIANRLYVSRATVLNDLKGVKTLFEENQLKITSHPNKGLLVEGNESGKRKFAFEIYLIYNHKSGKTKTSFNPFESFLLHSLEDNELTKTIGKIVVEVESLHHIKLTEESFNNLVFYLFITVKRIQKGFLAGPVKVESELWLELSRNILKRISQYCGIAVNKEEEKLLSNFIINLNYLKKNNEDSKIVTLQMITRKFIENLSNDLNVDLNSDYTFFENLVNHLDAYIYRENSVQPIEELFTTQGKPVEVYEAVNRNIHIIQDAIEKNINETELYYIVIHVCAAIERKKFKSTRISVLFVCNSGVGTSQFIAARLKNYFNLEVIDIVARHDLQNVLEIHENYVDLVISTIPLDQQIPVDFVIVSPELQEKDILHIYEKVEQVKINQLNKIVKQTNRKKEPQKLIEKILQGTKKYIKDDSGQFADNITNIVYDFFKEEVQYPYLYHLLQPEHIQLDVECSTYEEAIYQSAQKLLTDGYMEESYIQAMIRSVKEYGPYIVISEGFAAPHAGINDGSNRVGMNLIRLKDPIDFLGKPVNFVCCLSVVDAKKHFNAFFHLVNMLADPEFKKQLNQAKTPNEVSLIIKNFELKLL